MHRSRLSTILIDSPTDAAGQSAAFWSAALGVKTRVEPGEEQYTGLVDALPNMSLAMQSVDDAPRRGRCCLPSRCCPCWPRWDGWRPPSPAIVRCESGRSAIRTLNIAATICTSPKTGRRTEPERRRSFRTCYAGSAAERGNCYNQVAVSGLTPCSLALALMMSRSQVLRPGSMSL